MGGLSVSRAVRLLRKKLANPGTYFLTLMNPLQPSIPITPRSGVLASIKTLADFPACFSLDYPSSLLKAKLLPLVAPEISRNYVMNHHACCLLAMPYFWSLRRSLLSSRWYVRNLSKFGKQGKMLTKQSALPVSRLIWIATPSSHINWRMTQSTHSSLHVVCSLPLKFHSISTCTVFELLDKITIATEL